MLYFVCAGLFKIALITILLLLCYFKLHFFFSYNKLSIIEILLSIGVTSIVKSSFSHSLCRLTAKSQYRHLFRIQKIDENRITTFKISNTEKQQIEIKKKNEKLAINVDQWSITHNSNFNLVWYILFPWYKIERKTPFKMHTH